MFPRPLCSDPVLIFNRSAVNHLLSSQYYYVAGKRYLITDSMRLRWQSEFPFKYFNSIACRFKSKAGHVNWDALESSYVSTFNEWNETIYLFLAVPCGHCSLCADARTYDFAQRCRFESSVSRTLPIMVTLTYRPSSLPFICESDDGGVLRGLDPDAPFDADGLLYRETLLKSDVQKFLKRLRINWTRNSSCCPMDKPFRYVIVGEYGSKTKRPHYHAIFWNVPRPLFRDTDFNTLFALKKDIYDAWNMCDWNCLQCDFAVDAGSYVGKYLSKPPIHGLKGFMNASNRHGGIGHEVIDLSIPFFVANPSEQKLPWLNASTGMYEETTLGRYALKRIFPSVSSFIPKQQKTVINQAATLKGEILGHCSAIGVTPPNSEALSFNPHPLFYPCNPFIHSSSSKPPSEPMSPSSLYPGKNSIPPGDVANLDYHNAILDYLRDVRYYNEYLERWITDHLFQIDRKLESLDEIVFLHNLSDYPTELDTYVIHSRRLQHNNSINRPAINDSVVYISDYESKQRRAESLAKEVF
ncbi:MAG: hypothetical protein MJZ99_10520 [Bacteroidales bacterium]|nr:hypothetical protein [Bacteroidales bacterium]